MTILATIGAKALYLLFAWLLSAAAAAWMSSRKGYSERVGLTFGLILSVVGFVIILLLPARPGSVWKEEGPLPKRRGRQPADDQAGGPPPGPPPGPAPGPPGPAPGPPPGPAPGPAVDR